MGTRKPQPGAGALAERKLQSETEVLAERKLQSGAEALPELKALPLIQTQVLPALREGAPDQDAIRRAASVLKAGGLAAFPTETVYGLGGNALDPTASARIYAAKGRPSDNPLIVHIAELSDLARIAEDIPREAYLLAERFWPGPLTMILKKKPVVPKETTGGLETVAVRMPDHAAALALIREAGGFIAAPSANLSGRPSPTKAAHVLEDLGGRIEVILDGGASVLGLESTILDITVFPPALLRPGFITMEEIEETLRPASGEAPGTESGASFDPPAGHPKAPGMKYRHYAPKGELRLVSGEPEEVAESFAALAKEAAAKGIRTGILCSLETARLFRRKSPFPAAGAPEVLPLLICLGSRAAPETIASALFSALREMDEQHIGLILAEAYPEEGVFRAVMNRLKKASAVK